MDPDPVRAARQREDEWWAAWSLRLDELIGEKDEEPADD